MKQRPNQIGHYTSVSDNPIKIKNSEEDRHVQGSEDSGKPGILDMLKRGVIRECQPHPN